MRSVLPTALALALLCACGPPRPEPQTTTLIVNARLVDGTGAPERLGGLRIRDGMITDIGDLEPLPSDEVIDAMGHMLAPGFIDTHSHHDSGLEVEPAAEAAVSQGITTIIAGQDGGSPFPLADLFEHLDKDAAAVNVASFAGHNTLRAKVMGDNFRRVATGEEVALMGRLLAEEMQAGALGLSTGLEYDPGIYSDRSEVLTLAYEASRFGGRYISHMRSEDRNFWEALDELLEIGRQTRMPVQISHMKLAMRSLWGSADELIAKLDEARVEGIDVTADVYPYTYWQSTMTVLFPERDFTDRYAAAFALEELAPPEGLRIARFDANPSLAGKTLAEIALIRESDPVTTFLDLLAQAEEAAADPDDWGESIIATSMDENDIARLIAWPHTNICSDGGLAGAHPRGYGAFPRVLGRFVRDQRQLTWEEAVHRMTGLAASHMGIEDRGTLEPGKSADLILFDPETIADRATPDDPHLPSVGVTTVWVNGEPVWHLGESTGARPGRALRRRPIAQ